MNRDDKTILEKVSDTFRDEPLGLQLTTQDIIDRVVRKFPGTNPRSIIPSDYCYNLTNKGKESNPRLAQFKLFEWIGRGQFKYVGPAYKQNGPVHRYPRD